MAVNFSLLRSSMFLKRNGISTPLIMACRNTYILQRVHQPNLAKLTATRPRRLRGKHFVYELVEDTNLTEPEDLEVVLTTFVEGVGNAGDVISVMTKYARKHLLLPQRAVYATPENIEFYRKSKEERSAKADFSTIYVGMTLRFLSKKVVPVFMNSEKPWTIEPKHIQVAFRIQGITVPEEAIQLPETVIVGPDPVKENKDFAVTVMINKTETVMVRCRIFHVIPAVGIPTLSEEFYLGKREAIFKEQDDLLKSLPEPEIEDNTPENNISLKERYRIKLMQ